MAEKEIKIGFSEAKMEALEFFLQENNTTVEKVLKEHLDKTYEKSVPQQQTEQSWMQFCAPTTLPHLVLPTLWKLTTPASGPSLPVRTVISPTLRT